MYAVFFPLNQLTFHSNSTADEEVLKTLASLSFALNFVPDKESLSSNHYIHSACVLGISVKSGAELMEEVEICKCHVNIILIFITIPLTSLGMFPLMSLIYFSKDMCLFHLKQKKVF